MAVLALTSTYIEINSVDMSAYCDSVELTVDGVDLLTTNFGSGGWEERIGGLKSATLDLSFNQDFAATTVDDRIWPLFNTVVTFAVRPTSSAVGTTNPSYSGSILINAYTPLSGAVGDLAEFDVSWPVSGTRTRATS